MILIDTNVLLASQRGDHPRHGVARAWLGDLLVGPGQFGVPTTVWATYLRLTTNRRIFTVPTPMGEAVRFIDVVSAYPGHVRCEPGPRHFGILAEVCRNSDVEGDLAPDAVLAAIAVENGASVASFDRDFARFEMIDWIRP